jgi:integrase
MRFHDLRHACAILLLTKGAHPKVASEMRRHPSIMITLDTYSHMVMGLGNTAVKAMEDTLKQ